MQTAYSIITLVHVYLFLYIIMLLCNYSCTIRFFFSILTCRSVFIIRTGGAYNTTFIMLLVLAVVSLGINIVLTVTAKKAKME
jgi:hypothetical protein